MDILNARTARQFIDAWTGHAAAERALRNAAESQLKCASLSNPNSVTERGHLAAAALLDHAAADLRDRFAAH